MTMTDPIADMLTRIRNAHKIKATSVVMPSSKIKVNIAKVLLSLGYPEKGSVEGIQALKGKAKSVVSCAMGKMG